MAFVCRQVGTNDTSKESLTMIEHPMSELAFSILHMIWKSPLGVFDLSLRLMTSPTPAVMSTKASWILPLVRASYDPCSLYRWECPPREWMTIHGRILHGYVVLFSTLLTWHRPFPAEHTRTHWVLLCCVQTARTCHTSQEVCHRWSQSATAHTSRSENRICLHQQKKIIKKKWLTEDKIVYSRPKKYMRIVYLHRNHHWSLVLQG